ncbi:DUF924 family protein [Thalassovita taeanensis]|uniref:Uncharacterized conserved protein, DUF924 family n=1 Tax=Thalassovita taeanensis TaxID=657014 RepID=A0A1H8YU99_9RHOB|nr:DUF924 family protein [Thalassovita taeanensis]SEP55611.1 Uncharacterized conserved protein, DUF924 family [Thalassovita taeanensis]
MVSVDEILAFWLDEVGPKGWYQEDPALDQMITDRFKSAWTSASEGSYGLWMTYPSGMLAYIILMDQFPRNMFRGSAEAFSSDQAALAAAKVAIDRKWDLAIDEPARQFFYMPLMHSENLCDQDRCVRLMHERMSADSAANLLHAQAHREVIREFGRFPYRNDALHRHGSALENEFLETGGYGKKVRELQQG